MTSAGNRRPLASRQTAWAKGISRRLASTGVSPNQISIAGMVAALIAGACFWLASGIDGAGGAALLLAAALFTQVRLLCNLFDGMVAIESGRAAPDGAFWNEFPDRVSDLLILLGAATFAGDIALGWAAAAFSFLTAYVRELGINTGAGADFAGPMAKQHRMALVTSASLVSIFEPLWNGAGQVLWLALWLITLGAALTALRRSVRLVGRLRTVVREQSNMPVPETTDRGRPI